MTWEVDGREVASGEQVEIDADEFTPGGQEVSVVVRSSAGEIVGSDSITVEKVTDLVVNDDFIVFPLPCINLAGSADNRCLIRLKESRHVFECSPSVGFTHDIVAKDLFSGRQFSVTEPGYYKSPWGFGCTDNTTFDLFYGIWADVSSDRFLLSYIHDVFEFGAWRGRNQVTGLVHKTDPILESFSIPGSCTIESNETRCDIEVSWDGLYFAPSSALFFRRDGLAGWEKVMDMGLTSGKARIEDVVPFSGGQFAVFQYGTPFRVPSSSQHHRSPYRTLIYPASITLSGRRQLKWPVGELGSGCSAFRF